MAKNQNIPDSIEKQFNMALFKPGEPVCITWLGTKKYGYVQNYKKTNWGIQYSVESESRRYPCGIRIDEWCTEYTTGCIMYNVTQDIGRIELARRIANCIQPRGTEGILKDTDGSTNQGPGHDTFSRNNVAAIVNTKCKDNYDTNGLENDIHVSNTRVQQRNIKKRRNIKLDDAIQRQRDFLNGFVKKD